MPTPARIAVILLTLLGVLLLATATLIVLQQEAYVDDLVQRGSEPDVAASTALLLVIAYGIMAVTALVSAVFLPRRRAWARQTGVLVLSLLTVVSLLLVLLNHVVTPQVLLILASAIVGTATLVSRQTKDWVHGVIRTD
jgi:hypothetical protein